MSKKNHTRGVSEGIDSAIMTMNMYSVLIDKSNACNLREYTITYLTGIYTTP